MAFKENLKILPVAKGNELILLDTSGAEAARIANGPETAGSFCVYAFLASKWGEINTDAAEEGLRLYAEHTEDARANPGKHPNIDRLLDLLASTKTYSVRIS